MLPQRFQVRRWCRRSGRSPDPGSARWDSCVSPTEFETGKGRTMERRDVLKGVVLAAGAASAIGVAGTPTPAHAQTADGSGQSILPVDPELTFPDRFKGKTLLVTGCARGMGAAAALRAAREG